MTDHPRAVARRRLLCGLPFLAFAATAAPARADSPGLAVTCDTTLAPVLRKAAAAFKARSGVPVFVFPTGPGLILPQLVRDIQNDIVVTQVSIMQQAVRDGVVASIPKRATWRNPLVVATPRGTNAAEGVFAASDPSPASDIDGPAILSRLGVRPERLLGAIDTDEVAFLLATGAAQSGLLHMTDVRADPRLDVIRKVPADVQPPVIYAASVTRLAGRPKPEGFTEFLTTPEAIALLTDGGLEIQA